MSKYIPAILIGLVVAVVTGAFFGFFGMGGFGTLFAGFLGLLAGYLAANLQGTRAGPRATDAQRQAALSLKPSPGRALIIVYRQGFVGMAAGLNITLDGQPLAQIKSPQFTALEIAPGAHGLGFTFAGLAAAQNKPVVAGVDLAEGQTAAFRATLQMGGLKNDIRVERIDADAALGDVLRPMKMVAPTA